MALTLLFCVKTAVTGNKKYAYGWGGIKNGLWQSLSMYKAQLKCFMIVVHIKWTQRHLCCDILEIQQMVVNHKVANLGGIYELFNSNVTMPFQTKNFYKSTSLWQRDTLDNFCLNCVTQCQV